MNVEEAPQYLVARLADVLARDERTTELAVDVRVRGGDIVLAGPVSDDALRATIRTVVGEAAPGMAVHDEMHVVPTGEPAGREELT